MLMIHSEKQADKREERFDLFSSLLDATNHDKIGEKRLEDSELIGTCIYISIDMPKADKVAGNVFMFLLAGHEVCFSIYSVCPVAVKLINYQTTGHTLAFCFAFLALYPEKQEKLHQHIKSVMSDLGRLPVGSPPYISFDASIEPGITRCTRICRGSPTRWRASQTLQFSSA